MVQRLQLLGFVMLAIVITSLFPLAPIVSLWLVSDDDQQPLSQRSSLPLLTHFSTLSSFRIPAMREEALRSTISLTTAIFS